MKAFIIDHQILLTTLGDGRSYSQIPIFSVHVMCTSSRIVSQPNAEVLDFSRSFIINLFWKTVIFNLNAVLITLNPMRKNTEIA